MPDENVSTGEPTPAVPYNAETPGTSTLPEGSPSDTTSEQPPPQEYNVGGAKYTADQLQAALEAHKNQEKWQASNTQKAQELAAQREELQEYMGVLKSLSQAFQQPQPPQSFTGLPPEFQPPPPQPRFQPPPSSAVPPDEPEAPEYDPIMVKAFQNLSGQIEEMRQAIKPIQDGYKEFSYQKKLKTFLDGLQSDAKGVVEKMKLQEKFGSAAVDAILGYQLRNPHLAKASFEEIAAAMSREYDAAKTQQPATPETPYLTGSGPRAPMIPTEAKKSPIGSRDDIDAINKVLAE